MTTRSHSRLWPLVAGVVLGIALTFLGQSVNGLYNRVEHIEFYLEWLSQRAAAAQAQEPPPAGALRAQSWKSL